MASTEPDIDALKTALYDACVPLAEEDPRIIFNQASIFDLNIIPNNDVTVLLAVAQALVNDKLFKILQSEGLAWRLRSLEDARKYRGLKPEHELVYGLIDEAGDEGMWTKTIKARSNLHDAVFRAALKFLESKNLIKDFKSAEHPTRKMYIKTSVQPSDRAKGGVFHQQGELDEAFVEGVMGILYKHIKDRTFYISNSMNSKKPKKTVKKLSPEEVKAAKALRDKGLGSRDKDAKMEDVEVETENSKLQRKLDSHLPMPAGYRGYPTLDYLTSYVESRKFLNDTTLSSSEIQQLLDLLCFDNKIERIGPGMDDDVYKATRTSLKGYLNADIDLDQSIYNEFTEAPCGRCPVFDLCEEGGPVGPSNCEYFNDWLDL